MAEGLQIQIGADVSQAIGGLNQVNTAVGQTADQLKKLPQATGQANMALTNLGRVVQDAPFGFIGIANNIDPLLQSFTALKASTGSTSGALKALASSLAGGAGLGFAVSVATSLLVVFGDKLFGAGKAAQQTKSDADKLKESINGIFSETAKEASQTTGFVAILKSETETRQRKLEAIKELQKIQPDIFAGLKLEGEAVVGLDSAYKAYLDNLRNVIAAKIKQAQLEELIEKQLRLQGETLVGINKAVSESTKKFREQRANDPRLQVGDKSAILGYYKSQEDASKKAAKSLQDDIDTIVKDLFKLSAGIKTSADSAGKLEKTKINFDLENAFSDLTILEGKFANAFEKAIFYTDAFRKKLKEGFKPLKEDKIEFRINLSEAGKEAQKYLKEWNKVGETLQKNLAEAISGGAVSALSAIGEGIGNLMSGKGFGKQLFEVIGTLLQQLGKALIEFGVIKKITDNILKNPLFVPAGVALAAGILAIASGTMIKNFGGAREFGGPVSGNKTYLVGEKGPELFVPSVAGTIIPNNQIGSMGGRAVNSGGGSTSTIIRGQDIILAYARTSRSQSRVNG